MEKEALPEGMYMKRNGGKGLEDNLEERFREFRPAGPNIFDIVREPYLLSHGTGDFPVKIQTL